MASTTFLYHFLKSRTLPHLAFNFYDVTSGFSYLFLGFAPLLFGLILVITFFLSLFFLVFKGYFFFKYICMLITLECKWLVGWSCSDWKQWNVHFGISVFKICRKLSYYFKLLQLLIVSCALILSTLFLFFKKDKFNSMTKLNNMIYLHILFAYMHVKTFTYSYIHLPLILQHEQINAVVIW